MTGEGRAISPAPVPHVHRRNLRASAGKPAVRGLLWPPGRIFAGGGAEADLALVNFAQLPQGWGAWQRLALGTDEDKLRSVCSWLSHLPGCLS